jgi:hypothetical protein
MGTYKDAAARTAAKRAGNAVGLYDEKFEQALLSTPGVEWDQGSAASATDLKAATRLGGNNVGMYDELVDKAVAGVSGGLKGVITVPDIVGMTRTEARAAILAAGLRNGGGTAVASAEPENEVVTQSIAAGAAEAGDVITYEYSEGPVLVPDVVDMAEEDAVDAIEEAGLEAGTKTTDNSETIDVGNVISTDPAADTAVAAGSSVDYVVSLGPE